MNGNFRIMRDSEPSAAKTMNLDDPFARKGSASPNFANSADIRISRDDGMNIKNPSSHFNRNNMSGKPIDLGFDLLSNPRKKSSASDASSDIDSELNSDPSILDDDDIDIQSNHPSSFANQSRANGMGGMGNGAPQFGDFADNGSVQGSESSGSGSGSGSGSESSGDSASIASSYMSQRELIKRKKECLYEFEKLKRKGFRITKEYSMQTPLSEMHHDLQMYKKDRQSELAIKFSRKMLMAGVSGLELLTEKLGHPLDIDLDGWSESVMENITDYDEIFEELHDKYKEKANLPVEMKLLMTLGGSAFMFHLSKSLTKNLMGGGNANNGGGGFMGGMMGNMMSSMMGNMMGGMNGGGGGGMGMPMNGGGMGMPMNGNMFNQQQNQGNGMGSRTNNLGNPLGNPLGSPMGSPMSGPANGAPAPQIRRPPSPPATAPTPFAGFAPPQNTDNRQSKFQNVEKEFASELNARNLAANNASSNSSTIGEKQINISQPSMRGPRGVDDIIQQLSAPSVKRAPSPPPQQSKESIFDNISVDDLSEVLSENDRLQDIGNVDDNNTVISAIPQITINAPAKKSNRGRKPKSNTISI